MPFEVDRRGGQTGAPSLAEMTMKALNILKKNEKGFFLLVEGGRIDHALHDTKPKRAMEETLAMDNALQEVLQNIDLEDTLVVVTADHSHVMTMNGYPERGNDILGVTGDISEIDGKPYTTLMFTNGPGFNFSTDGVNVIRADPRNQDLHHVDYRSQTAVPLKEFDETHGGEDVAVWAAGPMSHLFHRTHEQHYVAHVMAYAACIGPSQGARCERPAHATITRGPVPRQPPKTAAEAAAPVSVGTVVASAVAAAGTGTVSSSAGAGPKFPTLSPVLQQLIETNEKKIVSALGTETLKSFTVSEDVRRLLGQSVKVPHSN
ncbi:hypothetical protein SK128_027687 [Halocaridina rubra]|uniref:alkaline phosphatase n=1 Tax=Halocaridina rubra TaxID=373956 RepID=A0AAN8WR57_HALRR